MIETGELGDRGVSEGHAEQGQKSAASSKFQLSVVSHSSLSNSCILNSRFDSEWQVDARWVCAPPSLAQSMI